MIRNGKDGIILVIALSLIYLIFSYVIFTDLGDGLVRFVSLFLIIPVPGIAAFLYGMWKGSSLESFLVGFLPVFIFFISGALFSGFEYVPLFSGLFLGACSGVIGYSGTVKRRGEMEWIVFAIIGVLLWIFVMLGGLV
ncbi:hypothetical protein [Candidatus Pyrohabitans sp.]